MKLLVAYDGSKCAEAAIDDLARSGLPQDCETTVVSIAEVWLPPPDGDVDTGITLDPEIREIIDRHVSENQSVLKEANTLANIAKDRIKAMFPGWSVRSQATYGSPAFEILSLSNQLRVDLIVVGSHGRSLMSRLFLGSVSQKVLTEARCSVRVARGSIQVDPGPERILVGFDGSAGSEAAVASIASRKWNQASEVRLVTVADQSITSAIGHFMSPVKTVYDGTTTVENRRVGKRVGASLKKLQATGLTVMSTVMNGDPKQILIEEAAHWGADCVFVGANASAGGFGRFLIGSTAAAVAARAHCSVEVSRS